MQKQPFEVFVYGSVPECIEVKADSQEQALERAVDEVLDRLRFCVGQPPGEVTCKKVVGRKLN